MKIAYEYSHLGGKEILKVNFSSILAEIFDAIAEVKATRDKVSLEKDKKGQLLYNPRKMNERFKTAFERRGFRELREYYDIILPGQSTPTITRAYKQIDFAKNEVLVEVQLGKYAFMFYDLAKFQYFFNESKARVGVEIVPAYSLSRKMSSGVAYGEQLVYDIERLRRHFPAVPLYILLIDADD